VSDSDAAGRRRGCALLIEAHRTCGAEVLQVNTGGYQCCVGTANVILSKYHSYRGYVVLAHYTSLLCFLLCFAVFFKRMLITA